MAEIPIQEKSSSRSWIWLLALLAIAAIAWMLFANNDEPEPVMTGALGAAQHAPAFIAVPLTERA